MDAGDVIRKKLARVYATIQNSPQATTSKGQVPNNPPLTPDQIATIKSQYPTSDFAFTNNIYPCGAQSTICSTIYTAKYYYNNTN